MNSERFLSMDEIQRTAPSVFANHPIEGVSDRYTFIPTIHVVEALINEGWAVTRAEQNRVRLEDRRDFTRHMLRFRRPGTEVSKVNDLYPEIVLINSHDRGAAYQMHAGLFRLVCTNGLIIADSVFSKVSIRHTGDVVDIVRETADDIIKSVPGTVETVRKMQAIELTPDERGVFAAAAASLKWGDEDSPRINTSRLLTPRRYADGNPDLWTTFNVVQENIMKGGISYYTKERVTDDGERVPPRRNRTRKIQSITEDVRLNKALWMLADEMRKLKTA